MIIISHQHKFIFIRTKKTASTSMDMILSGICGPEDVISPLTQEEEEQKAKLGFRNAQNFHVPVRRWTLADAARFVTRGRRPRYTKHMSIRSLRPRLAKGVLSGYFKFCVERNPFDRAVSLYYWRTRSDERKPSLVDFLRSLDQQSLSNFHIYSLDGVVVVDQVLRFERLEEGLKKVSARLGLGELQLPRTKTEYRTNREHYREIMSAESRSIVERACAREIELLQYEF